MYPKHSQSPSLYTYYLKNSCEVSVPLNFMFLLCLQGATAQTLALGLDHGQRTQSCLALACLQKYMLQDKTTPLRSQIAVGCFPAQTWNPVAATGTVWPSTPKISTVWPFIEKGCRPWYMVTCSASAPSAQSEGA